MASKKKVVDIAEVKDDIALVEESDNKEAVKDVVNTEGNVCVTNDTQLPAKDSETGNEVGKKHKVKDFIKKYWKKILIFLGLVTAAGAAGYVIGKKSNELSDEDVKDIGRDAIKNYWVRINELFENDPENEYAVSVTNNETGKIDWLVVTSVDSIPEWVSDEKHADLMDS